MIVNLGDREFKEIFNETSFFLPKRWDGKDFEQALGELFNKYQNNAFDVLFNLNDSNTINNIKHDCAINMERHCEAILKAKRKAYARANERMDRFYDEYRKKFQDPRRQRHFSEEDERMARLCKESIAYYCDMIIEKYSNEVNNSQRNNLEQFLHIYFKIAMSCSLIQQAVTDYLRGFPSDAYDRIDVLMTNIINESLGQYQKSTWLGEFYDTSSLKLYRAVSVEENVTHLRERIFHPPYNLSSKVSTNRYSIAGFPSLYLGTSVELCLEEMHNNPYEKYSICSRFEVCKNHNRREMKINVLELGIKPQDFSSEEEARDNTLEENARIKNLNKWINNTSVRKNYLVWYPLIASCSFIRAHRKDPFAPEYIIPQLLMQWLRKHNRSEDKFLGLRYFSCYSERSSDLGFNYVFPTSGLRFTEEKKYCSLLGTAFVLTRPLYLHNFKNIEDCEAALNADKKLKFFYED
ncbi:MAG: hypothetical protein K2K48_02050 [Anaeroplasmataceae bacterium]|nr:hypothetical protein [Anaeroplasmataceae bacterium]MDE6414174.1 hypothetical protein [Anaeroplasmataceae bacterium]